MRRTTTFAVLFFSGLTASIHSAGCSNSTDDSTPGNGGGIAMAGGAAGSAAGSSGAAGASAGASGASGKGGSPAGGSGGGAGASGKGGAGASGKGGASGMGGAGGGGAGGNSAGTGGASGDTGTGGAGAGGDTGGTGAGGDTGTGGAGGDTGTGGAGGDMGGAGAGAGGASGAAGSSGAPLSTKVLGAQADVVALLTQACADDVTKLYDAATFSGTWDDSHRGDILRCAYVKHYDTAALAGITTYGVPQHAFAPELPVHEIALAYWTSRPDATGKASVPVLTTGVLLIPDQQLQDGMSLTPLVGISHGSVGLADKCAPSKFDPDEHPLLFASYGYVTVQTDYPGVGTPGAPAWLDSVDEGHSVIDSLRAVRKLMKPGFLSTKNAISGHSEGGHGALSADAFFSTYGGGGNDPSVGTLEAVNAFAPVWFSQSSWGAVLTGVAASMGLVNSTTLGSAAMYFYGHLAVHDGETHSTDAFVPAKAAAAKMLLENSCFGDTVSMDKGLSTIGVTMASDLFTSDYINAVGNCSIGFGPCDDMGLATKWTALWTEDRPAVDQNIPLSLWAGGQDGTIPPDRQQCGIERMTMQTNGATPIPVKGLVTCGDQASDHSGILNTGASWVRAFFAEKMLGTPPPPACVAYDKAVSEKDTPTSPPHAPMCPSVPANSLDVTTP